MMRIGITLFTLELLVPVYVYEIVENSFLITTQSNYDKDLNVNSDIHQYNTNLVNYGIDTTAQWDLVFEVKSCGDSFILLTPNADLTGTALFEIDIGGWSNSRICVNTGSTQSTYGSGSILDCNNYKFFWLKWTVNGDVSFGTGNTVDFNTVFTRSTGSVIGGLGVRSGFGHTTNWRHRRTVCSDGTYGTICTENCGHCLNVICERDDGTCPTGCQPGWIGTMCFEAITTTVTTELTTFETTQSTTDTISTTDAITTRAITTKDTHSSAKSTTQNIPTTTEIIFPMVQATSIFQGNNEQITNNPENVNGETTFTNELSSSVQNSTITRNALTTSGMTGCCPCSYPTVPFIDTNQNTDTESVVYKVDKLSLSSYKSKHTSASDPRKSSMYIGACGVAIISSCILFIVALDFLPDLRK